MRGSILSVPVRRFKDGASTEDQDLLAVEEPLQIRIGGRNLSITMRTPGHDAELAAGFLFTEGLIKQRADIAGIECAENEVIIALTPAVEPDPERLQRNFYMTSSCGVCGKASIEAIEAAGCTILPRGVPRVNEAVLVSLPARLREAQSVFEHT